MSVQIAVRLAEEELQRLDAAIARGTFANRADAVRAGLARVLLEEREAQIEEAYRRAYDTSPEEDDAANIGLTLGAQLLADDAPGNDDGAR